MIVQNIQEFKLTINVDQMVAVQLKLLERIILASSNIGDTVLDPFSGSGTTGVACIENKRSFIGIDSDLKFCKLSVKRFKKSLKVFDK